MCSRMPPMDPVLVLADRGADDEPATQATRELLTVARRVGVPVALQRPCVPTPGELAELAERVRDLAPVAVLIPADPAGEETAARLAVRLEAGIVADVVGVSRDGGSLFVIQEVAGGTCRIATELRGPTPVITLRRGAFPAEADVPEGDGVSWIERAAGAAAAQEADPADASSSAPRPRVRVLSRRAKGEAGRELVLGEADVVVAGGRGVGSAEGFSLLARLASALGGCLGGTHTARELGWCPEHARISLPGAQIRPRLYLAGGVSGSLRHRAAIRRARTVVAVDRDPDAPIFREADFGVVGDLHEVLPALLEELARRSRRPAAPPGRRHPEHRRQDRQQDRHQERQQRRDQQHPPVPADPPDPPDPQEHQQPDPSELAEA